MLQEIAFTNDFIALATAPTLETTFFIDESYQQKEQWNIWIHTNGGKHIHFSQRSTDQKKEANL